MASESARDRTSGARIGWLRTTARLFAVSRAPRDAPTRGPPVPPAPPATAPAAALGCPAGVAGDGDRGGVGATGVAGVVPARVDASGGRGAAGRGTPREPARA